MMPDPNDFEARLADAFRRYAGRVPTDVDAAALAREIATASARDADRRRSWWPFGHAPIVTWRTRSMFSPAKAIVAGALFFGIGAAFLIAQPFSQSSSVPGAVTDAAPQPPTEYTGVWCIGPQVAPDRGGSSTTVVVGDELSVNRNRGGAWRNAVVMSDPRLQGDAYQTFEKDTYTSGPAMIASTLSIVNDEGAWVAAEYHGTADGTPPGVTPSDFIGEDAYEGLVAHMEFGTAQVLAPEGLPAGYGPCNEVRGVIFDHPPVPLPYLPE